VSAQLSLHAQTFTTLVNFNGTNGDGPVPQAQLVQGLDGNLWGVTEVGGVFGAGTIFKMSLEGTLMTEFDFNNRATGDTWQPMAGLALASSGLLYGTTQYGGPNGEGTFFSFKPRGLVTLGPGFGGPYGYGVSSSLVRAFNGVFYGTTQGGGANGPGTVFEATAGGGMSVVYTFQPSDVGTSGVSGLIQGFDGNLYGTTSGGGTNFGGSVFKVTPTSPGTLTTLYSFAGPDGYAPLGGLVLGSDGNFYGTTFSGGTYNYGTVFKITPAGRLTTLHNFRQSNPNGMGGCHPAVPLVQASDGNFYGTTTACGANGLGTVFRITPFGSLSTLYSFDTTEIPSPIVSGGLVQATDGNLYGTFASGGQYGQGMVFRFAVGLTPFVKTLPAIGKVGSTIEILGTGLIGARSVTFNGVPTTFSVKSASLITAVVPTGATSGKIEVTTSSGTLQSNVAFYIY